MRKRKAPGKKLRFEVFKRDAFTCQYCGRKSPDVILELDHVVPVVKGGQTTALNLLTSCKDCNSGKGPRSLSDGSAVDRQRKHTEDMQARAEQIRMMVEWRTEISEAEVDAINDLWKSNTRENLTPTERHEIRKHVRRFGATAS